jgi:hypothetical protein
LVERIRMRLKMLLPVKEGRLFDLGCDPKLYRCIALESSLWLCFIICITYRKWKDVTDRRTSFAHERFLIIFMVLNLAWRREIARNCWQVRYFRKEQQYVFVSVSVVLVLLQRKSLQGKDIDSLLFLWDLYCIDLYRNKALSVMNEVLVKWLIGLRSWMILVFFTLFKITNSL